MSEKESFEGWCVLELLGHRRVAGFVSEQEIAGAGMIRIDVPGSEAGGPAATQFYNPAALYALTPTTEEIARAFATRHKPQPVSRYELPPVHQATTRPEEYEFNERLVDAQVEDRGLDCEDEEFDESPF